MDEKELLELAAKAAGIQLRWNSIGTQDARRKWEPLDDDGDALRLAVKLGIEVSPGAETNRFAVAHGNAQILEERRPDPYAATRRAIVRAAAEIGKTL